MIKTTKYEPSPFALAPQSFAKALPRHCEVTDEDLATIKIPGWRYDAIDNAVLRMYEKADVHTIPLSGLDIALRLNYSITPYRAFGQRICDELLKASPDALSGLFRGAERDVIFYNDRQPPHRVNFSLLHEIGHIELGHKEQSPLAEIEANHFAAVALCPTALLEHYKINDPKKVSELFNISLKCAVNRLKSLNNSKLIQKSAMSLAFAKAVIERLRFEKMVNVDLFGEYVF